MRNPERIYLIRFLSNERVCSGSILHSCVTWGNLLNYSVPQFPHLFVIIKQEQYIPLRVVDTHQVFRTVPGI